MHMGILIVLFILLFLLLLLSMPLIVEARTRVCVRGAVGHARVYLLGLIPVPVRLRLNLLQTPYFTLQVGKKQIRLFKKRKKRGRIRLAGVRLLRLDTRTAVGVEGEPAVSVLLAGTAAVLLSMLTTRIAESGSATAALCERSLFRIALELKAIVHPVLLAAGIVHGRIKRRKAANTIRKTNEKRTEYASC